MKKRKNNISLYNEDFKLITGAMPIYNRENPKESHKAILKRIRETYKTNKAIIDAKHEERHQELIREAAKRGGKVLRFPTAYMTFKNTVMNMLEEGQNVNNAIRATFNSTWYTTEAERGRRNIWTALRRDKALFHDLRKFAGWKQKLSPDKLEWDKDEKRYVYDGKVEIYIQESPKKGVGQIHIRMVTLDDDPAKMQEANFYYDREVWAAMHK